MAIEAVSKNFEMASCYRWIIESRYILSRDLPFVLIFILSLSLHISILEWKR